MRFDHLHDTPCAIWGAAALQEHARPGAQLYRSLSGAHMSDWTWRHLSSLVAGGVANGATEGARTGA
jgi:hypothetical protein